MKAGELRGAFAISASTQSLIETSRANSLAIFLISFLTLLLASSVMFFLVRKLVVKPLSAAVDLANAIAGNNLALDDLPVETQDEIGEAGLALNIMKNNLRKTVEAIAETSVRVGAASERLSNTSQQITANSVETSAQADVVSKFAEAVSQNLQTVLIIIASNKAKTIEHWWPWCTWAICSVACETSVMDTMNAKRLTWYRTRPGLFCLRNTKISGMWTW